MLQVQPVPADADAGLHAWRDKTPALAAIKGTGDKGAGGASAAKGKEKGGKAADGKGSKSKKK